MVVRLLDLVASRIAALEFGIARYVGASNEPHKSSKVPIVKLREAGMVSGARHETYARVIASSKLRDQRIRLTGDSSPLTDNWIIGSGPKTPNPGPKGFVMTSKPSAKDESYTRVKRSSVRKTGEGVYVAGSNEDLYRNHRKITVKWGKGSLAEVTKVGPRKATFDLISTEDKLHGTPGNAAGLRKIIPVMKNLKKKNVSVHFHPLAMSNSTARGAVKDTATLLRGYIGIAKKIGFKYSTRKPHLFTP